MRGGQGGGPLLTRMGEMRAKGGDLADGGGLGGLGSGQVRSGGELVKKKTAPPIAGIRRGGQRRQKMPRSRSR